MNFNFIIDSHTHWGPSITLGSNVSTENLLAQQRESGVTHVVIMPFPSTAIYDNNINIRLLEETKRIKQFVPYHYIREDYDKDGFDPIPDAYFGGKWHWMRGIQDSSSNYNVLDDKALPGLINTLVKIGKPVIFEEEFSFTERFVDMVDGVKLIIPHLGLLGGNPYDFLDRFNNNNNVYFDTALADQSAILKFVQTIGPERILFGSDVPFGSMKSELMKITTLPIPDSEKDMLLYENFIRLTDYKI